MVVAPGTVVVAGGAAATATVNCSCIPGDTAEAGKRRFASLLELHKPTLVIIEIGGNDFLRRRAPKAVKEDLRSMIHAARQEGAQVVLIAVPELSLLGALTRAPADSPIR